MGSLQDVRKWLPERLAGQAIAHGVPGAVVAVLAEGEVAEAAYGVLNRATGVEVTTDSLFQIGSITKVWTATLIMQLADDGQWLTRAGQATGTNSAMSGCRCASPWSNVASRPPRLRARWARYASVTWRCPMTPFIGTWR
jgi:hypothetical protein